MAPIQDDDCSLLHLERISQYVSLPPACLATPLPAVCALTLSPLLLSYFPPAKGIVLSYSDVQLSATPPRPHRPAQPQASANTPSPSQPRPSQRASDPTDDSTPAEPLLLKHVDEYAALFLWVTASFLVWRPRRNAHVTGRITHQSHTHITLAHLNTFPVSVLKEQLPSGWAWHGHEAGKVKRGWDGRIADEGGWWVDGDGGKVADGGELKVRIRDFEGRMDGRGRGKGFLRIEGSLVSREEEMARALAKGGEGKQRVITGVLRLGKRKDALADGEVVEIE